MAFNLSIGATLGSGNNGGQAPSAATAGSSTNGPDLKEVVTEVSLTTSQSSIEHRTFY